MMRKLEATAKSGTVCSLGLMLAAIVLCGCARDSASEGPAREAESEQSSVDGETVFDPLLDQRDRVQQQVDQLPDQRKAELDRAIEADEQ
jgi:hypothetical protein